MIFFPRFRWKAETSGMLKDILGNLRALNSSANIIMRRQFVMTKQIEDLREEVTRNRDVTQSAVSLLSGIADRIAAAQGNEEALKTLETDIRANTDSLAAAVTANTPPPAQQPQQG